MSDISDERITVMFSMTADDYARYHAVSGQTASAAAYVPFLLALFAAIPVALLFRWLELNHSYDHAAAEMVGWCSLTAFVLGFTAMFEAMLIAGKSRMKRYLANTVNAFEPKTAVFDHSGLAVIGQLSRSNWQWKAVSRLTHQKGLLLFWLGATAVAVPSRSFGSEREAAEAFIRARLAEVRP